MKKTIKALAVAFALTAGITAVAQTPKAGINPADMDTSVKPGDDFYEYAGGGWMKANPLKPEYSSYGIFDLLADKNREQLRDLFAELAAKTHERGSVGQKVTDLYNLAMDSVRLNREGAAPLKADLAFVASFKRASLTEFLAKAHLTLDNPFFGVGVDGDLKNSDVNALYMSAGTSGLPDRDYYLNTDADSRKIQAAYRAFLAKILTMAGYKPAAAKRAAATIYKIEYAFAQAKLSRAEARDYSKLYNIRTVEQLQKDYPAVNWTKYFSLMGLGSVKQVILMQPKVMAVANKLMSTLTEQEIREELARLTAARFLSPRQAEAVDTGSILRLFSSPLGKRIMSADARKREFKFSLLCPAEKFFPGGEGESVLMQGVIDCMIEENGELTIIDYKTDRVCGEETAERAESYARQLEAYAYAAQRMTGKPVRECVLYFLYSGETVKSSCK